jgi:OmcA/MtrC family decaheme c-type cytochrome
MAVSHVSLELRRPATARRAVIDIAKCNSCHDDSGAGLSFHGTNRTLQTVSCSACHNGDATDIARRPADPNDALDGKREETIDIKRMIHGIHTGENLFQGLVLYGFGGNPTDFSHVSFLGNNENCRTCHLPGTYSTEDASVTTSSTIDTSTDVTDPADDLRISRIAAACSSCHDDGRAQQHMVLNGASFMALEENILMAPEPSRQVLVLAALAALTLMQRHRARWRRG